MDFSSCKRALLSLQNRKPSLNEDVLSVVSKIQDHNEQSESIFETYKSEDILSLFDVNERNGKRWEPLAVGILLTAFWMDQQCKALNGEQGVEVNTASNVYADGPRQPCLISDDERRKMSGNGEESTWDKPTSVMILSSDCVDFCEKVMMGVCRNHLEHDEPRVRTLIASVIGSHARIVTGYEKYFENNGGIMETNLYALQKQRCNVGSYIGCSLYAQASMFEKDRTLPGDFQAPALDDTTGWRSLETSLIALASWSDGYGAMYLLHYHQGINKDNNARNGVNFCAELCSTLENCSSKHINRHVRAAGLQCLEQIVKISSDSSLLSIPEHILDKNSAFCKVVTKVLTICLSDNWSQVRMAASVLNREFLIAIRTVKGVECIKELFPTLLPRMCLNRFYLAQGVQLYSKDTWRIIFDATPSKKEHFMDGALEVSKCAGNICRYYVKMCDADNHVVREAACQAVAEVAERLGCHSKYSPYIAPFVPMLLQALILCFHDESWPVRDEACLACGKFVKAYPDECREDLPMLFERWTDHLSDQIWSVREDAAVALGDALEAYNDDLLILKPLLAILKERIPLARKQPAMTKEELLASHNNVELHTNSQLYSCGSLAPKLKKRSHGGCSDCVVNRERMPWEATDGCIYVLREMTRLYKNELNDTSNVVINDSLLLPLMEDIVDVCRVKHFPQSDDLRATLWKQLPIMAKNIGKTPFKRRYLQLFIQPLMENVGSSSASKLSKFAATTCCCELAKIVGEGIFRGRCEEFDAGRVFDFCVQDMKTKAPLFQY